MDKYLQSNTMMKVVAFLMALMLWMIVNLDERPASPVQEGHRTLDNVRVEMQYDEGLYSVVDRSPETVQVKLRGNRVLINSIISYRVVADLRGLGEGKHTVPLKFEGFPAEVDVEIQPKTITVVLEQKEAKAFPIEIELTGKPQQGYTIGELGIEPEEVHVIAPSSVLDQIALVKGFVSVDKVTTTFSQDVNLKIYDRFGNEIMAELSPKEAHVKVPVKSPSMMVPLNLKLNKELPEGLSIVSIESHINEVEVQAPRNILEKITGVEVGIDLSKITASQIVQYPIPIEDGWDGIEPQFVQVDIRVAPTQQRTLTNLPLKVEGLKEGFELEYINPADGRVHVTVLGSRERLNQLTAGDVVPTIDISALSEGEHVVDVNIHLPMYVALDNENQKITIRIRPVNQAQETTTESTETIGE